LKTVDIPLFANQSLMPGVADDITSMLSTKIVSMKPSSHCVKRRRCNNPGKVTDYSNTPRTYGTTGARQVTIAEYVVDDTVDVEFVDNKGNTPLYKGTVTGLGVYNFQTQTEADGRKTAKPTWWTRSCKNRFRAGRPVPEPGPALTLSTDALVCRRLCLPGAAADEEGTRGPKPCSHATACRPVPCR